MVGEISRHSRGRQPSIDARHLCHDDTLKKTCQN